MKTTNPKLQEVINNLKKNNAEKINHKVYLDFMQKQEVSIIALSHTQTEKTHRCLSNMKEHKLSECPSLKGFIEVSK